MSKPEDNGGKLEREAFAALEGAIDEALGRLAQMKERAEAAEARSAELDKLVQRFTGDEAAAGQMLTRLKRLEAENADLRSRLTRGRAGVDRLLAKIRFLENQQ